MQPLSEHPDCRFRRTVALPQCPGDAQACAPTAKGLPICGRFTVKATWAEIVALYRLALDRPPHNLQPRYNLVPPTY
jgi:hypothetical protein